MKKRFLFSVLIVLLLVLPLAAASAATYYYVSGTASLKIRENPDANARVKDSYRADYAVVSYKKYDANWAYVHFSNGEEGYVMRRYLKSCSSSTAYVTKDKSALRSGPAASFAQNAELAQGDKVRVLTRGAVWSYISAPTGTGYVRNSLLSAKPVKRNPNAGTPYTAYVTNPTGRKVNVRRGPGKGYAVDGELEPGTQIRVDSIDGNWAEITGPVSGWMMRMYVTRTVPANVITPAPGSTAAPSSGKIRYITSPNGKSVNVRHGPSEKGYAVRITLDVGDQVEVLSTANGWSRIKRGVVSGYVRNEFLTSRKPGSSSSSSSGSTAPTKAPYKSFKGSVVSSDGKAVNVRRAAGKGYSTVTQLKPGTSVTVTDEQGNWYKISFDGGSGYIMKEYVKKK